MRAGGILCLVAVSVWLSACGKAGGDGPAPSLTVSASSLRFSNDSSMGTPPEQVLHGRVVDAGEQPVYIDIVYSRNGLDVVTYDSSTNPFSIFVRPRLPAEVGVKTVKDTIVISVCEDAECTRHLSGSPREVEVSYTVSSIRGRFEASPASLYFSSLWGDSTRPGRQTVALWDVFPSKWKVSASESWLKPVETQGSAPGELTVEVDPTGLSTGARGGKLLLTNTTSGELLEVPVTLQVFDSLTVEPASLAMGGPDGIDLSPRSLSLSLYAGHGPWSATVDTGDGPPWLRLSSTYGVVTSARPTSLTASVDTTGLRSDTPYSATVTFTALVEGRTLTRTVPVTLRLASHKLWVEDPGVALVSTPSVSKLGHTVRILDSWKQNTTAWTATSNQPWLSVPASGSGDSLSLTANPAGLAPNTLHLATVTFGCTGSGVACDDSIQVGLWVGSTSPNSLDALPLSFLHVETDPIRPQAYVHDGGNTLSVYNLYTAGLVTQLTGLGGSLGAMTVSHDGSTLYVLDKGNRRIIPVDLRTLTARAPWSVDGSNPVELVYARPNGLGLVLTNTGTIHEATTGAVLSSVEGGVARGLEAISASLDGSLFCGTDFDKQPYSLYCHGLRATARPGGIHVTLSASPAIAGDYFYSYDGVDVGINHDGSRVYVAATSPYDITVFDGETLRVLDHLPSATEPRVVEVGPDGRVYGAGRPYSDAADSMDTRVYDGAGRFVRAYRLALAWSSIRERQLKVSGDGLRFVVLTREPALKFVTSP